MKAKVYLRVAENPSRRTPFKVAASATPTPQPLRHGSGYNERDLHTLSFALVLDIPDELLKPADWPTVEVQITPNDTTRIPIEVEVAPA
jgi:hypothetical protein